MEYFVMGKSLEHVESYTITGGLKSRMAPYQRRTTKDILLAELHVFHSFQPHQSDILCFYMGSTQNSGRRDSYTVLSLRLHMWADHVMRVLDLILIIDLFFTH